MIDPFQCLHIANLRKSNQPHDISNQPPTNLSKNNLKMPWHHPPIRQGLVFSNAKPPSPYLVGLGLGESKKKSKTTPTYYFRIWQGFRVFSNANPPSPWLVRVWLEVGDAVGFMRLVDLTFAKWAAATIMACE